MFNLIEKVVFFQVLKNIRAEIIIGMRSVLLLFQIQHN
jgi:hypothetical protein